MPKPLQERLKELDSDELMDTYNNEFYRCVRCNSGTPSWKLEVMRNEMLERMREAMVIRNESKGNE
ncbi:hypothetical protein F400_gp008 [Bacillus phage BCD7]|uniref:Uncharacterized protein n=1 Tax=Bacillus phage BCD7 TaxID=1136534 RepID=J9PV80_9CAUD|nr:hypothetical protein F400_gp008 [Bacillus phage BCD7]AEZ50455.1 hypothetical protein BCD7_0008 [Bacillus phage BCD7]